MESMTTFDRSSEQVEDLIRALKAGYDMQEAAMPENMRKRYEQELDEMDSDSIRDLDLADTDESFSVDGNKELSENKELAENEAGKMEEEKDDAIPIEESDRAITRMQLKYVDGFNEQEIIKSGRADSEGLMQRVQESVDSYKDMTGRDAVVDETARKIDEDMIENARGQLEEIERACQDYIDKKDPLFAPGKKRKDAIMTLQAQVRSLREDEDDLKICYEELYLPEKVRSRDEDDNGMGDDDGKKKRNIADPEYEKNRKKENPDDSVQGPDIGAGLPFEIDVNGDMKPADTTGYKSYTELTAEKRFDEVRMSNNALLQLTIVKAIGFMFGITDWQQIVDPETLLYNEEGDEVRSIQITMVPGMFSNISEKMSDAEGRRFAEALKGDAMALKMLEGFLGSRNAELVTIERAAGISSGVLMSRMSVIRRYIKEMKNRR